MLKRRASIPVLTAIALGLMAAVAPAHTKTFPTTFSALSVLEGSRSTVVEVTGDIDSKNQACVRGRQVRAGFFNPASGLTSGIRATTTDSTGAFSVEVSRRGTIYKVQAEKKTLPGNRKHRHKCGRVTKDVSGP
jgi:hypothetical protein